MNGDELFAKVVGVLKGMGVTQEIKRVQVPGNYAYVEAEVGQVGWMFDFEDLAGDYEMWFEQAAPEGSTPEWMIGEMWKYAVNDYVDSVVCSMLHIAKFDAEYNSAKDSTYSEEVVEAKRSELAALVSWKVMQKMIGRAAW